MSVIFTKPAAGIKTDYLVASDISNDSTVSGVTVKDTLEILDSDITAHASSSDHDNRYYRVSFGAVTLDAADVNNKYINLTTAPSDENKLYVFVKGGLKGDLNVDYTISGARMAWSGLEWDGLLEEGDILSTLAWY